ncbi:hypothetical protein [Deinococcus aquatilis]|uniref:hypothetical protein n=1 Tax=Deinococcus aquatilis TaxID=519440 RepID=UPI001FE180FB|nr:hypothetical protein [Deinococcus aquatilis]
MTSALQIVARLAHSSPFVAVIEAPVAKAVQIAQRQAQRYPTIDTDHGTRTALRKIKMPAVQLVIMPPEDGEVAMLLLSNVVPADSREHWHNAFAPYPLTWRNYELTQTAAGRITWRLSTEARQHYRARIARLITGRGGQPGYGKRPYQLPPQTAHDQIIKLAAHLQHYPGLSGIRSDVFDLAQYSTRVWTATHSQEHYPVWPTMPYARFSQAQTAPLPDLIPLFGGPS